MGEVMLKIWSSLIHAGKVSAKFAIDVKDGKISFCCVKEFAYNAYVATAANVGKAIEYCKTQIEIMTK